MNQYSLNPKYTLEQYSTLYVTGFNLQLVHTASEILYLQSMWVYQSVNLAWCSCWLKKAFSKESRPSADEKQNLWMWFESRRRKLSSLTNLGLEQINPTLLTCRLLCSSEPTHKGISTIFFFFTKWYLLKYFETNTCRDLNYFRMP